MVLFILALAISSQETYPANSQICDLYDSDRDKFDCRKTLAGGFECHNNGIHCTSIWCSDRELAETVGMLCNESPTYNGGYPMSSIHWDEEYESYDCIKNNTVYCTEWHAHEQGTDEYELGVYTCIDEGPYYCIRWESHQKEVKNCDDGWTPYPPRFHTECRKRVCDDEWPYDCYDEVNYPEQEIEVSEGWCTHSKIDEDSNVSYCDTWSQREWDPHDSYSFAEMEDYICLGFNGIYCTQWSGIITSEEEFEVTECIRNTFNKWSCHEKGHDMFFPNVGWVGMSLLFTMVFVTTFIMFDEELNMGIYVSGFLGFFTAQIVNILFVWLGGLGELAIRFGIIFVPLAVWGLVVLATNMKEYCKSFGECVTNSCVSCKDKCKEFCGRSEREHSPQSRPQVYVPPKNVRDPDEIGMTEMTNRTKSYNNIVNKSSNNVVKSTYLGGSSNKPKKLLYPPTRSTSLYPSQNNYPQHSDNFGTAGIATGLATGIGVVSMVNPSSYNRYNQYSQQSSYNDYSSSSYGGGGCDYGSSSYGGGGCDYGGGGGCDSFA